MSVALSRSTCLPAERAAGTLTDNGELVGETLAAQLRLEGPRLREHLALQHVELPSEKSTQRGQAYEHVVQSPACPDIGGKPFEQHGAGGRLGLPSGVVVSRVDGAGGPTTIRNDHANIGWCAWRSVPGESCAAGLMASRGIEGEGADPPVARAPLRPLRQLLGPQPHAAVEDPEDLDVVAPRYAWHRAMRRALPTTCYILQSDALVVIRSKLRCAALGVAQGASCANVCYHDSSTGATTTTAT